MARICKDCPEKLEQPKNETVRELNKKKNYFFPNENIKIQANSYEEALEILNSINKE